MCIHRFIRIGLIVTFGILAGAAAVPEQERTQPQTQPDIPIVKPGFDSHQFAVQTRAFMLRYCLDAYKQYGRRDPKWDEAALKYVDGTARSFAAFRGIPLADQPGALPRQDGIREGRRLIEAGCDDSIVNWTFGLLTIRDGPTEETKLAFKRSVEGLEAGPYDPYVKMLAWACYGQCLPLNSAEQKAAFEKCWQNRMACMFRNSNDPMTTRIIYDDSLERMEHRELKMLADRAKAEPDPDPWMYAMVMGRVEMDEAAAARDSDGGEQDAAKHNQQAAKYLIEAHRLHPDYPEAAALMIDVAFHGDKTLTPRQWFDRAVAAYFDYMPAYFKYEHTLRHSEPNTEANMLAFGVECLNTNRFDTDIPHRLIDILRDIHWRTGDYDLWKKPETFALIERCFEGEIAYRRQHRSFDLEYMQSYYAAMAWRCARYDVAKKILDGMSGHYATAPWKWLNTRAAFAVPQIYAYASSARPAIEAADACWEEDRWADAIDAYKSAAPLVADDPMALHYVNSRLKVLDWANAFAEGRTIHLTPAKDLSGWQIVDGKWSVDEKGRIIGQSDASGLILLADFPFGHQWELRGTVDLSDNPAYPVVNAAIFSRYVSNDDLWAYLVWPHQNRIMASNNFTMGYPKQHATGPVFHFVAQRWENQFAFFIDGELVFSRKYSYMVDMNPPIGIGAYYPKPHDYTACFSDLTFRSITHPPDWLGQTH